MVGVESFCFDSSHSKLKANNSALSVAEERLRFFLGCSMPDDVQYDESCAVPLGFSVQALGVRSNSTCGGLLLAASLVVWLVVQFDMFPKFEYKNRFTLPANFCLLAYTYLLVDKIIINYLA